VKLILSREAAKNLAAIPKRDAAALMGKLQRFADDPAARHASALPMQGAPDRVRIRQGDWRAVLLIVRAQDAVIVERLGHRREVYR
jgi:mRNA-degrading endonuclease RelE of RelBE toxin-antitoxin system